jgi:hypothetical protein
MERRIEAGEEGEVLRRSLQLFSIIIILRYFILINDLTQLAEESSHASDINFNQ